MSGLGRRIGLPLMLVTGGSQYALAGEGQTALASVELIQGKPEPGLAGLPRGAPRAVMYYKGRASTPSCGLLPGSSAAKMITPILETESTESFPYCLAITEGAAFSLQGARYFVFGYRQRDTREDSSSGYFFVRQSSDALLPLEKLNGETTPERKSIQYMASWAKSSLVSLNNEKDSYRTETSNSIVMDSAFLNVSRNEATGSCRTVVDSTAADSGFAPVTTSCKAILATTALTSGSSSYFIVLMAPEDRQPKGQIFAVSGNAVREDSELEKKVGVEISSGKVLNVKAALRKMAEAH